MKFKELSGEQRRQFIDVRDTFVEWREAERNFQRSYRGSMRWQRKGGTDYLMRKIGKAERSLGPRSPETEKVQSQYKAARARLRQRSYRLRKKLDKMRLGTRALFLGRVPRTTANILRRLDRAGVLGSHVHVVGTNALYAYEARTGINFSADLTATKDADLLLDERRSLRLVVEDYRVEGLIGLLKQVDSTFSRSERGSYRAINSDGFFVDLICPTLKNITPQNFNLNLGEVADEIISAEIFGLHWLINSPKFSECVIAEDNDPLWISCIDPRVFSLHKLWLSRRTDRDPIKKPRDAEQAAAVAAISASYFGLRMDEDSLTALPKELLDLSRDLPSDASSYLFPEDSDIKQRGW